MDKIRDLLDGLCHSTTDTTALVDNTSCVRKWLLMLCRVAQVINAPAVRFMGIHTRTHLLAEGPLVLFVAREEASP